MSFFNMKSLLGIAAAAILLTTSAPVALAQYGGFGYSASYPPYGSAFGDLGFGLGYGGTGYGDLGYGTYGGYNGLGSGMYGAGLGNYGYGGYGYPTNAYAGYGLGGYGGFYDDTMYSDDWFYDYGNYPGLASDFAGYGGISTDVSGLGTGPAYGSPGWQDTGPTDAGFEYETFDYNTGQQ